VVRVGEVETHAGLFLDPLVVMELGAVVSRDGLEAIGVLVDQPGGACGELVLAAIRQLADQGVAGLAFYQRHDAILAAGAHHRIDFPMADLATLLDARRPLADVPLASQAATTVVATVALAPLFAGAAQVFVQPPAATFVSPDVLVDGLVADRQHAVALQPGGDLLRTPQVRKQALDQTDIVTGESPIASRTRATAACATISLAGPIGTIVAAVATDLSGDAAGVPPQHPCDLRGTATLRSQGCEHIPLSRGDLAIRHGDDSLLAGKGSSPVSQIASLGFQAGRCALTC